MKILLRRCLFSLCILFVVSLWGCGSSSGSPFTNTPGAGGSTQTLGLEFDLENLPSGVDEIGILGLDSGGEAVLEIAVPPTAFLEFQVPTEADRMLVTYLAERRMVGVSVIPTQVESRSVRAQTIKPTISSLEEAVEELRLNNTDVEIPQDTIVLLKVNAVLANSDILEIGRAATWVSSDPTVATVRDGLVKGISTGETTIIARLGSFSVETTLTVGDLPDNLPVFDIPSGDDSVIDLSAGTLNGKPLPGWNATNQTVVVESIQNFASFKIVGGRDFVLSAREFVNLGDVVIRPSSPSRTPNSYLYSPNQVSVLNYDASGYTPVDQFGNPTKANTGWGGGDFVALCDDSVFLTGLNCNGSMSSGPAGRGGTVVADGAQYVSVSGFNSTLSVDAAQIPGDIFVRSQDRLGIGTNTASQVSARAFRQENLEAGRGGRITMVGRNGIDIDGIELLASGGQAPDSGPGGPGGDITLISLSGEITSSGLLDASGGSANYGDGGAGGRLRVLAQSTSIPGELEATGGASENGSGGAGGKVIVTGTPGTVYVEGGPGNPNSGPNGTVTILGTAVTVEPGTHEFNTVTGRYDGIDLPGWDPIYKVLTSSNFEILEGATLVAEGRNPFSCEADSFAIEGVLTFPGADVFAPALATPGGSIFLSSDSEINISSTGVVQSPGGNSDGPGADGGLVQLFADMVDVSGQVNCTAGESSDDASGSGGLAFISAGSSLNVSGTVDCSGRVGFNRSGDGGKIGIVSLGTLECLGSVLCPAGQGGLAGGRGGAIALRSVGMAILNEVNCNGADSGIRVGDGGEIAITGSADITLQGPVSTNAGSSDQNQLANGGTILIDGRQTVSVTSKGSVSANGSAVVGAGGATSIDGQGGTVRINGDQGVTFATSPRPVSADAGGTIEITP